MTVSTLPFGNTMRSTVGLTVSNRIPGQFGSYVEAVAKPELLELDVPW